MAAMHRIDDSFSIRRTEIRKSRRTRFWRRLTLAALASVVVCLGLLYGYFVWHGSAADTDATADNQPSEAEMLAAYAPDIIDLAGSPLRIELPDDATTSSRLRWYAAPAPLAKYGIGGSIAVLHERILPTSTQIMLKIPSTQRDFAFFEAQKVARPQSVPHDSKSFVRSAKDTGTDDAGQQPGAKAEQVSTNPADDSANREDWGELNGSNIAPGENKWKKTAIEDNVSTAYVIPEASRQRATTDRILQVTGDVDLTDFLTKSDINPVIAKFAGDAVSTQFSLTQLTAGSVVALRFAQQPGAAGGKSRLVQIALYEPGKYIGALAASQDGTFLPSVDPWADKDLSAVKKPSDQPQVVQKYRLIDGVYSAAIRNGIGTRIAGEAVMQLSKSYDLAEYANESDWVTLLYAASPREQDGNQTNILYVSIDRADSSIKCYVTLLNATHNFGCFNENGTTDATTAQNGMVMPVEGVMTSAFGPRLNPVLKKVVLNNGVDWTAPVGTPVRAAYAGTVEFAGDKGNLGNFIQLDHTGHFETSYAHLSAFAAGLKVGTKVKAGDLIGYVGSSGHSAGPHLHFEAYRNHKAVDPLQMNVAEVGNDAQAVQDLINRIIHVESGGKSDAKNPRSSATGLGQFIDSTWIRMISSYRPELMSSLTRVQVLALRTDPTISREMLGNLARENEDYLKSRGHPITAAHLYLAHFLGPGGADQILSAPGTALVSTIVGASVMSANPHLNGMTVNDINAWTERVMGRKAAKTDDGDQAPQKVPVAPPADYIAYKGYIEQILKLAITAT
jgi:murein DD-endopeptidase MepM/ murein hydrolase activator NlpD